MHQKNTRQDIIVFLHNWLNYRLNRWQRWLNILIRTAHIGTGALLFGGTFFHAATARIMPWHHLTIISGLLLLILEWYHDRAWPHRIMGIFVYLHVLLGIVIHLWPTWATSLLWGIIIIGCLGSHMPRRLRHWSLLQGEEKKTEER